MIDFYAAVNHVTGLMYQEGGGISLSRPLYGDINELFTYVSPITGDNVAQYRKLHIKNNGLYIATGVRLWTELPTGAMIFSFARETIVNQTIGSALLQPIGSSFGPYSGAYASGLDIGTMYPGGSTGIWVSQQFRYTSGDSVYTQDRIYVGWKE